MADRIDFYCDEDYLEALSFEVEIDAEHNAKLEQQFEEKMVGEE